MTAANLAHNIPAAVTANIPVEHEELFYQSAEFWVGIAFVLVVAALFKPGVKAVKGLIIKRIARIKNEFQEAENLKLEAQKLYAGYERKFLDADDEVARIIAEEEAVIADTKERKIQELNRTLAQKQREVEGRIELAFEQANKEINTLISSQAVNILKKAISSKLTKSDYNRLIDNSIETIQKTALYK